MSEIVIFEDHVGMLQAEGEPPEPAGGLPIAVQANRGLLNYRGCDENREGCFAAIQAAMGGAYGPVKRFVRMAMAVD